MQLLDHGQGVELDSGEAEHVNYKPLEHTGP